MNKIEEFKKQLIVYLNEVEEIAKLFHEKYKKLTSFLDELKKLGLNNEEIIKIIDEVVVSKINEWKNSEYHELKTVAKVLELYSQFYNFMKERKAKNDFINKIIM